MYAGEGGDDVGLLILVGAQHRGEDRVVVLGEAGRAQRGEHPGRSEFEERGDALVGHRPDRVGEADTVADMPHPVLGIAEFTGEHRPSSHRGYDRYRRRTIAEHLGQPAELGEHRRHQRRVEGVADPQPLRLVPGGGDGGGDLEHGGLGAGDHHRGWPVHRRQAHLRLAAGEQRANLLLGGLHGDHRALGGELLHESTARGDQDRRVLQGEHPGDVGSGQLADRVSGKHVGAHPPRLQQPELGDLHGEQRALGVGGLVQQRRLGGAGLGEQHVGQGHVQLQVQPAAGGVERGGVDRIGTVELTSGAEPLAALPGEEEPEPATGDLSQVYAGQVTAVGEHGQLMQGGRPVPGDQDRAVFQRGPGGGQRVRDVKQRRGVLAGGQGGVQRGSLGAQRRPATGGEHHRQALAGRRRLGGEGRFGNGRGLLDDDVRVGPADAERGDPGAARPARIGPLAGLGEQFDGAGGPVDGGGGGVDVQGARQHPVPYRHQHLDHPGDTGGGLRVPDVGLERAEPEGPVGGAFPAVGGDDRLRLDRVTEPGAGAVCLDHVDVGGGQAGGGQRRSDHPLLGRPVRSGQPVRCAILVDRRSADHAEDAVAVA